MVNVNKFYIKLLFDGWIVILKVGESIILNDIMGVFFNYESNVVVNIFNVLIEKNGNMVKIIVIKEFN